MIYFVGVYVTRFRRKDAEYLKHSSVLQTIQSRMLPRRTWIDSLKVDATKGII